MHKAVAAKVIRGGQVEALLRQARAGRTSLNTIHYNEPWPCHEGQSGLVVELWICVCVCVCAPLLVYLALRGCWV